MAHGSAIILPMVKDLFLIGFIVVEGVSMGPKTGKLRPVKPVWPPKKGTQTPPVDRASIRLSKQQLTELPKIARTLALACVVDQVYQITFWSLVLAFGSVHRILLNYRVSVTTIITLL